MTDENKRKLEEIRTIPEHEDTVEAIDVAGDVVPLVESSIELHEFSPLVENVASQP